MFYDVKMKTTRAIGQTKMLKKAKNNTKKMEKHGGQLVWDKLGLKLSVLPPRSTLGTHNTLSTALGLH